MSVRLPHPLVSFRNVRSASRCQPDDWRTVGWGPALWEGGREEPLPGPESAGRARLGPWQGGELTVPWLLPPQSWIILRWTPGFMVHGAAPAHRHAVSMACCPLTTTAHPDPAPGASAPTRAHAYSPRLSCHPQSRPLSKGRFQDSGGAVVPDTLARCLKHCWGPHAGPAPGHLWSSAEATSQQLPLHLGHWVPGTHPRLGVTRSASTTTLPNADDCDAPTPPTVEPPLPPHGASSDCRA